MIFEFNCKTLWLTVNETVCVLCSGGRCLGVGGRSVCHEKAICHDEVEGGVLCECLEGYRGDGYSSCTGMTHKPLTAQGLTTYAIERYLWSMTRPNENSELIECSPCHL